jgi:acyl-CoA reductase-like NAD-dependent aldehyde dehydrogenase
MQIFQQYIDGAFTDGSAQFESRDPATGQVWAKMPEARADDVNAAVKAAATAFV